MLEDFIIVGIVISGMEIIKKTKLPKETYFIPILAGAAILNAVNAYFFGGGGDLTPAVADGIRLGALAAGVYGLGKAALGKS